MTASGKPELRNIDLKVLRAAKAEAATVRNLWKPDIAELAEQVAEDGNLPYSNAYLFKVLFDLKKPATCKNGKATEAATSSTQKEQTTNDTRTSHAHSATSDIRHGDSSECWLPSQWHLGNRRRSKRSCSAGTRDPLESRRRHRRRMPRSAAARHHGRKHATAFTPSSASLAIRCSRFLAPLVLLHAWHRSCRLDR